MSVDPELKDIRPIILGAVVKNIDLEKLNIDADFIKITNGSSRKLHFALGQR